MVRTALREILPNWALLGMDFVGSSILEVSTDINLEARLISTLKKIGAHRITDFDVPTTAVKKYEVWMTEVGKNAEFGRTAHRPGKFIEASKIKAVR